MYAENEPLMIVRILSDSDLVIKLAAVFWLVDSRLTDRLSVFGQG